MTLELKLVDVDSNKLFEVRTDILDNILEVQLG